jgi:hypothetical protein
MTSKQDEHMGDAEDQFRALLETVENLRATRFASLDATLVRDVLRLHASGEAADAEVSRRIEQAIDTQLAKDSPTC